MGPRSTVDTGKCDTALRAIPGLQQSHCHSGSMVSVDRVSLCQHRGGGGDTVLRVIPGLGRDEPGT